MKRNKQNRFYTVDLFAGCGGFSEGFYQAGFEIVSSVENNRWAANTLLIRKMFRILSLVGGTELYWNYVRENITLEQICKVFPDAWEDVRRSVIEKTISEKSRVSILTDIQNNLKLKKVNSLSVLIGGPPCQLYSLIGRARYSVMKEKYYRDVRRRLFEDYVFLLKELKPDVFVFENVYGIVSSELKGKRIIEILFDLFIKAGYIIPEINEKYTDYILNAADYGVPQIRKRFVVIGIKKEFSQYREEVRNIYSKKNKQERLLTVRDAIGDLPPLHPGEGSDRWYDYYRDSGEVSDYALMLRRDSEGIINHRSREHMYSDLERYRFFIEKSVIGEKADLRTLINERPDLIPNHRNLSGFLNRFKVQKWDYPSLTITAHLAGDGHYYIHPDINQVRSFTAREAARCQSFPDNYFFSGPRTEQFRQIGNAVPPLMAKSIADKLYRILTVINSNENIQNTIKKRDQCIQI